MPLRASKESPQGLALSLEHLKSWPWDPVPPGWFTALSCRLCTLPWLLPLSQRECYLGAALTTSVEGALGHPLFPKQVLWSAAGAGCSSGMPSIGGQGSPPDVETSFKHCHSMSPALAAVGTGMHLDFCTGTAQPQLLWLPMGTNPRQCFYLFDPKQPLACCSAPGQLSAPPQFRWQWEGPLVTPPYAPHSASSHLKVPKSLSKPRTVQPAACSVLASPVKPLQVPSSPKLPAEKHSVSLSPAFLCGTDFLSHCTERLHLLAQPCCLCLKAKMSHPTCWT